MDRVAEWIGGRKDGRKDKNVIEKQIFRRINVFFREMNGQDNTYHGLCYTSCGALAGTRIAQWVHPMNDRSDDPSHHERTLYL